ncbi:MAG: RDD family protein [Helicobacteraceae bacterium]|jgi:uncharacterized RDD family membrane protein YckC|nr:RDD family protein [Helicobacteraceae bacterium]
MKAAGFWQRAAAQLVDVFMILTPIIFLTHIAIGYEEKPLIAWAAHTAIYGAVIVWFSVAKGYTPGKKYARLIIIDTKANLTMTFPQAIWRFVCFISTWFFGFIWAIARKDKRALHDILSRTRVIRL